MYLVIVNENFHDLAAYITHEDEAYPLTGWERVWSTHHTREEANAELRKAREHLGL